MKFSLTAVSALISLAAAAPTTEGQSDMAKRADEQACVSQCIQSTPSCGFTCWTACLVSCLHAGEADEVQKREIMDIVARAFDN
ncbi:hypothetical protein SAPIO_CDS6975 [Scedosporium apiospermum]|uniref:Extracellular membrane protein CFEM domain-containing protein n=1 Tax=Pseudallescheria apiosperma TaxID=563466 RepID=A0A084G2U5_PSEDA|nr:uncharacterized protein SAPIO_CDS6975 [Scedosporium apiospermum]KEZ41657.1 hypothetical protein SAPIO_CDS6975 [Scedosporium apiospermum]